ncbi:MAG: response regulator [candidate division WOR-3 bacterium]|nr:response regulator [candidate division WOR-3 bacterium]
MENKKILIIEDDILTLHSLYLSLSQNYKVEGYSDAHQAIRKLKENSYDLIISDLFLNDLTGLDIYNFVKDKDKMIIITGYPEKELALKAKELLGDRFIPKSTPPDVLKSKIVEVLMKQKI